MATLKKKGIRARIGQKIRLKECVCMKAIKKDYRKSAVESKGQRDPGFVWFLPGFLSMALFAFGALALTGQSIIILLLSSRFQDRRWISGMKVWKQSRSALRNVWEFLGELFRLMLGSVTILLIGTILSGPEGI